jgi:pyruvate kinase
MEYEIIATVGPASGTEQMWESLLAAGVSGFRLNTSHVSLPQLRDWIQRLSAFLGGRHPRPQLVLDLQGSKWRLGQFAECVLTEGQQVTLACAGEADRPDVLPVPHRDFFRAASLSSGEIVLDDAKIRLALEALHDHVLSARVMTGGAISPRKGITYTDSRYRQESLSETDRTILEITKTVPDIRYALSYVRDALEMAHYRTQIGAAFLIAKLERQPAVGEAAQIAESADQLWLCRGDLGAELGARAMADAVHHFSHRVATLAVPVLLAGQVFEHMTEHPQPTRSEVCAAYDALRNGYRGFVLSDETAVGRHPVDSCRMAGLFRA